MELWHILVYFVIATCSLAYLILRKRYSYWAERGVIHEEPKLLFGNIKQVGRTQAFYEPFRNFYLKYRGQAPFGGFYISMRPAALLLDLDLVKDVLIKDFSNFAHRGNFYNERDDPLSGHIFNLDGPKWRTLRTKLTPTFTSGKMKFMFPTVVDVAQKFIDILKELIEKEKMSSPEIKQGADIEIKELLARFTTDVIGTCAFGLDCNSLRDPNAEFRIMGRQTFQKRRHGRLVFAFMQAFPNLARKLHMKNTPENVSKFFLNVVRETVEYREKNNVKRNDFMDLLIELKNRNDLENLTLEEVSAQAFVFFLAGFETSSSTMSFCLYLLALHQDVQDKARAEIEEMFKRHGGEFTYEGVRELKYLQQILYETMRMYSIATLLMRKTINDYQVPGTKHVIEKNTVIIVPVDAIHHDPEVYPNPEIFDPERFSPEEIKKRHPMAWLPFGDGPRNCIGLRFGEMQAIIGLTMLLHNCRFTPAKETQIPLVIDKSNFLLASEGGIVLNIHSL